MEKRYMIIYTDEDQTDMGIQFVNSDKSMDEILLDTIESQGFDLSDDEDASMADRKLGELPIGIAEYQHIPNESPDINWYYELPDIPH